MTKLYVLIARVKPEFEGREDQAIKALLDHLIEYKIADLVEIIGSELVGGDTCPVEQT